MRFEEIPGLTSLKKTLINNVDHGHVAHAQLFLGKEGYGSLPLALAYATYLNCGQQKDCHKYEKLIHPDLHFVFPVSTTKKITAKPVSQLFLKEWRAFLSDSPFAALSDWAEYIGSENKQLQISKEESRNIVKDLSLKAFEAKYKVMLIWLPELMHSSAANAILKILEEPPPQTVFLLVSNSADSLLATILSRTQLVHIPPFSDKEITQYLIERQGVGQDLAAQVAYLAEGNLNEAIKLSQEVSNTNEAFFKDWMRDCFKNDYTSLVKWSDQFQRMGKEAQKNLMRYALNIFRESMLCNFAGKQLIRQQGEQLAFVSNFAKVVNDKNLDHLVNSFNEAYYHLERNANAKMLFITLSVKAGHYMRMK